MTTPTPILDWAAEIDLLKNADYSPPSPSYYVSHTPPGSPPSKRRAQETVKQEDPPQQEARQKKQQEAPRPHRQGAIAGHIHLAAIANCGREMIADKVFGIVCKKARNARSGFVAEFRTDEYTINPITGQHVYYINIFDRSRSQIDYIGQIENAVFKISNGKLKMHTAMNRDSIRLTLQDA